MPPRPFNFRFNSAELFSQIHLLSVEEKADFITQLATDLITLNGTFEYSKMMIEETMQLIEKKSINGKKGGRPKTKNKAKDKQNKAKVISSLSNKNKNNEEEKDKKEKFAELVTMTQEEHNKLIEKHGSEKTEWMIDKLNNAKGAKGYKYESDYRAILNWVVAEADKNFHPVAKMKTIMNPITGMSETVPIESLTWQ